LSHHGFSNPSLCSATPQQATGNRVDLIKLGIIKKAFGAFHTLQRPSLAYSIFDLILKNPKPLP